LSIPASGAVTVYRGVGYNGAQATVAGQAVLGFANEAGVDGRNFTVNVIGTMLAEAGGAVNVGDALDVDASGRVVTHTTGIICGRALAAATAAGQVIEILSAGN
jgi:hypothetical protein